MPSLHVGYVLRRLDYIGVLLYVGGLLMLMLGITWGGSVQPWSSPYVIGMVVGGLATSVALFASTTAATMIYNSIYLLWHTSWSWSCLRPTSCASAGIPSLSAAPSPQSRSFHTMLLTSLALGLTSVVVSFFIVDMDYLLTGHVSRKPLTVRVRSRKIICVRSGDPYIRQIDMT